jgi:hypothetical protein
MYVIVGAGPSGLTLAYLLGRSGKQCVVIDRETVIGGCHRVLRVDGLFTEHSPRVYLSSYINFAWLLKEMGIESIFSPNKTSIFYLLYSVMSLLKLREILYLGLSFFLFLLNPKFGEKISTSDWCCWFSESSKDILDRFCRFTDGAGADRYSIYKLLQLANQNIFYNTLQPKLPNDIGLFSHMKSVIESTGNVSFLLGRSVERVLYSGGQITGVISNGETILCQKLLLCVPPVSLNKIFHDSGVVYPSLSRVVDKCTYDTYLSATFHYNDRIVFPWRWGFPMSEWGLISIPLSKYMVDSTYVFSVTCMYLNRKSSVTGKSINELENTQEILQEMFRQLKQSYPELPVPNRMILSPTAYREGGEWKERDSAYIHTVEGEYMDYSVPGIGGLYQIGTQNGNSNFAYTTLEAAVTNSMVWYNKEERGRVPIQSGVSIYRLVWTVVIVYVVWRVWKSRQTGLR